MALFTVIKHCKKSRCPSTGEWIDKLVQPTIEYYSAIKQEGLLINSGNKTAWMDLLSEDAYAK